jgi:hypothetical protein
MAELHIDLAVPRWEDIIGATLWVRYKPSNPALYAMTIDRLRGEFQDANANKPGSGDPEWTTRANADVLVKACIAIFDLPIGEMPPDVLPTHITYPTFASTELADTLEIPQGSAIATARALYLTDNDLTLVTQQLFEWSGQLSKKTGDSFLTS